MNFEDVMSTAVKIGICSYGIKRYRLFICKSEILYGTGDYEDEPEFCDDIAMTCYAIWFEDIINSGIINTGGGYYKTISEAINKAESTTGFIEWIK